MSGNKKNEPVTKKDRLAFALHLAHGESVASAAKRVRIAESTAHRWKKHPEVRQAIEDYRRSFLEVASNRLASIATRAVETLADLLRSETEKIRLASAKAILDSSIKLKEVAELEQDIERIKEMTARLQSNQSPGGKSL